MNHHTGCIIHTTSQKSEDGFIALISAIIISAVLMIVISSVGFSGFMTRFNILDSEYKARSYTLAEGYANDAMIKLAQELTENPSIAINETVNYPVGCTSGCDFYRITGDTGSPKNITIEAHSVVERATTNMRIIGTYSGGSLTITGREEVPGL